MNEVEEWRPVVGFENSYEVSNFGRVRSKARISPSGNRLQGKLLKQSRTLGYPFVGMRDDDGKQYSPRVHALVAAAFIGPRPKGKFVNHIDCDKTNNHVSNLEYVTPRENVQHAVRNGRMGCLSVEEVQAIRSLVARDPAFNLDLLADKLDVGTWIIQGVVEARTYTLIPNKDGSAPVPLLSIHGKTMEVEDIADLQTLGFTIPQIGRYYNVEYSAPYQALRRAGIWQDHSKLSTRGSGRRTSKQKELLRQVA